MDDSVLTDRSADDTSLIVTMSKVAFLARLVIVLFVALLAPGILESPVTFVMIVLVTIVAVAGLFWTEKVVRLFFMHPIVLVADIGVSLLVIMAADIETLVMVQAMTAALLIGLHVTLAVIPLVLGILVCTTMLGALNGQNSIIWSDVLALPVICVVVAALGAVARLQHERVLSAHRWAADLEVSASRHQERLNLAREMHDSVSKTLHGLRMATAALPTWVRRDPEVAVAYAQEIETAINVALEESRALMSDLRQQGPRPVAQVVQAQVDSLAEAVGEDIAIRSQLDPDSGELSGPQIHEFERILAEVFENVVRHSNAKQVQVALARAESGFSIAISDDGVGFDPEALPTGRYGLAGIQERASRMGARLTIDSRSGGGTHIQLIRDLEQGAQ